MHWVCLHVSKIYLALHGYVSLLNGYICNARAVAVYLQLRFRSIPVLVSYPWDTHVVSCIKLAAMVVVLSLRVESHPMEGYTAGSG